MVLAAMPCCSLLAQVPAAPQVPAAAQVPTAAQASMAVKTSPTGIRLNQLGFYGQGPKIAIVTDGPDPAADTGAGRKDFVSVSLFYVLTADAGDTVFKGRLGPVMRSANSSLHTRKADFSSLEKEGNYVVDVPGRGRSYTFRIGRDVLRAVVVSSLRGYYYQRSAMALDARYAGKWSRGAGHRDTLVRVHPSAASPLRPAGTIISSAGGWYDAGDYNKYIVNSGITMGTLLGAYEDFPRYYDTLCSNIPESGDGLPDILNESLYNLRWMLTMQDPGDGGVYHKCTNAAFDGMVMPGETKAPRYVVQKGTAATLDFAAVMAQAARVLRKFPAQLPGLSDSCLHAAIKAWRWAQPHPAQVYDQQEMNSLYSPKITTGAYGDRDFRDEWFWAAVELSVTMDTMEAEAGQYKQVVDAHIDDVMELPSWGNVYMMGVYTLLRYRNELPARWSMTTGSMRQRLLQMADDYIMRARNNAFCTVMGSSRGDFVWGSNAVAANQGMLLVSAWLLTQDRKYFDNACGNMDYLMGRNATGYCFVTGMGTMSPQHPHHRPSVADGIAPPVPGLLVGGPNPGRQDQQYYHFTEPELAYEDKDAAYASNEIAINWNAPLVYLAGAMEALQYR